MNGQSIMAATWVLGIFTGVLALATLVLAFFMWRYVRIAKEILRASGEEAEAMNELSNSIRNLPQGFENIQLQKGLREKREQARSSQE
jgi:hypothetical protein